MFQTSIDARLTAVCLTLLAAACECDPGMQASSSQDSGPDATFIDGAAGHAASDGGSRDAARADATSIDASTADAAVHVEPTLTVTEDDVRAALHCPSNYVDAADPVLLVHGTGANAALSWDDSYVPVLTAEGFDVCTLDLPAWSWESIPLASEYVVVATRLIATGRSRPVAWVGHSQGSLEFTWAMTFFPSLASLVSDVIFLASVTHGAAQSETACGIGACRVAAWQMRPSSAFVAALVSRDETPSDVPYSSIYSTTDSTAVAPTSVLVGATNVSIQSLCPGRSVSHAGLLTDAVAYALVLDALTHDGPVDPSRVDASICDEDFLGALTGGDVWWQETQGGATFASTYLGGSMPNAEPALPDYAL